MDMLQVRYKYDTVKNLTKANTSVSPRITSESPTPMPPTCTFEVSAIQASEAAL